MVVLESLTRLALHTLALAATACASLAPQTAALRDGLPAGLPPRVELTAVPFFPQAQYQCGPAALATALVASGANTTPDELVPQVYLPARKGSLQAEMLATARRHGRVSYQLAPRLEDLLRELADGTPVIVLQNLGLADGWHYAVVVGYDHPRGELILRSGEEQRAVLSMATHEVLWKRGEHWAMVALPPGRIPATADAERWLQAVVAFERSNAPAQNQKAYASYLERWPDSVTAAIGLANAYYAAGALKEAEQVLRGAARREPDSVVVLNNLAQTLSDMGRNEEALPLIERATARGGPHASEILKTRETILRRLTSSAGGDRAPR